MLLQEKCRYCNAPFCCELDCVPDQVEQNLLYPQLVSNKKMRNFIVYFPAQSELLLEYDSFLHQDNIVDVLLQAATQLLQPAPYCQGEGGGDWRQFVAL